MRRCSSIAVGLVSMLGASACATPDDPSTSATSGAGARGSDEAMAPDEDGPGQSIAPMAPVSGAQPGSSCSCDADCHGDETHPGVCVYGVCMRSAASRCSASGSSAECPEGSRCWSLDEAGQSSLCWPDCASFRCAGACDDAGSCTPTSPGSCDASCGSYCEAPVAEPVGVPLDPNACAPSNTSGTCPEGADCIAGTCIRDGCPDWRCESGCNELVAMPGSQNPNSDDAIAAGYYIATERRYAFLRRDLTLLLRFAACEVSQRFPDTRPIGISDMSQADGLTPGMDECGANCAQHPTSTHRGDDIDLAYYQTDGANDPQIICGDGSDRNSNGRVGSHNDGYFCTTEANIVDWPRQLWWFARLAESSLVRVFGIDETLADDFQQGARTLYEQGEVSEAVYRRMLSLGWGNEGGWAFHHHHTHHSYNRTQALYLRKLSESGPGCQLHMSCPSLYGL